MKFKPKNNHAERDPFEKAMTKVMTAFLDNQIAEVVPRQEMVD